MSLTPYCTETELEQVLSEHGVTARLDDSDVGTATAGYADAAIEKATASVNRYLLMRYTVATCAASTWVKWATAVLACLNVCRHRNLTPPQSLIDEWKEFYEETLNAIRKNQEDLMGDTGPAAQRFSMGMRLSNLTVDGRYQRQKVRVTRANSVDGTASSSQPQHTALDYGGIFP